MSPADPDLNAVRRSAILGAALAFVITFGIALAFGAELWQALVAGAFIGVVVGGGLGFLVAGQRVGRDT